MYNFKKKQKTIWCSVWKKVNEIWEGCVVTLPDNDDVDVFVSGFDSLHRLAMDHVDEKVQRITHLNIPTNM